ncbi:hypothetical protein ACO2Q3_19985 [Caulobacter sp. KR2-114]|uniref:hypothetical protein n=1 Tax=Caulobacter sp. KR2-114 TaxID=3400912 RepID=UPI003C05425F
MTDPIRGDQPPPPKRMSGPWVGTWTAVGVMALLLGRLFLWEGRLGDEDQAPMLFIAGMAAAICILGVGIGWIRHFRAQRENRNRRKPMSLG